jgi:hypothetical protein
MCEESKREDEEDVWFTAEGEEDGQPLIFRGRREVPSGVVKSDYHTLLSIYWPYEPANESGMPDDETYDAQIELDDALEELDLPGVSFLMLVCTGNGQREWHWYVSNVEAWMGRLNELLADYPVFPIQIRKRDEPDWALYQSFVSDLDKH